MVHSRREKEPTHPQYVQNGDRKEHSQFHFLAWTLACGRFGSGTGLWLKPLIYSCHQEL
jgi:hypothetical protein